MGARNCAPRCLAWLSSDRADGLETAWYMLVVVVVFVVGWAIVVGRTREDEFRVATVAELLLTTSETGGLEWDFSSILAFWYIGSGVDDNRRLTSYVVWCETVGAATIDLEEGEILVGEHELAGEGRREREAGGHGRRHARSHDAEKSLTGVRVDRHHARGSHARPGLDLEGLETLHVDEQVNAARAVLVGTDATHQSDVGDHRVQDR